MKINVIKLIDDVGGSTALWKFLAQAGNAVSLRTIESWKQRDSLSMNGLLMIEEAIKTKHLKIKLEDYYVIDSRKSGNGTTTQTTL